MTVQRHAGDYHYAAPLDYVLALQIVQARHPPTHQTTQETLYKAAVLPGCLRSARRIIANTGARPGDAGMPVTQDRGTSDTAGQLTSIFQTLMVGRGI